MSLTPDTGHTLSVQMAKDVADVGVARLYTAAGGGGTTHLLNVRDKANAAAFAGLVASSANDPRKLCVRHRDVDSMGEESFVKHYLHVLFGGIQYTVLERIEDISSEAIAAADYRFFKGEVARDHTDHYEGGTVDYYPVDANARIYNSHFMLNTGALNGKQAHVSWNLMGGWYGVKVWARIDGSDSTLLLNVAWSAHASIQGDGYFAVADGSHTVGFHIQYVGSGSQLGGTTTIEVCAQNETNAGDVA